MHQGGGAAGGQPSGPAPQLRGNVGEVSLHGVDVRPRVDALREAEHAPSLADQLAPPYSGIQASLGETEGRELGGGEQFHAAAA